MLELIHPIVYYYYIGGHYACIRPAIIHLLIWVFIFCSCPRLFLVPRYRFLLYRLLWKHLCEELSFKCLLLLFYSTTTRNEIVPVILLSDTLWIFCNKIVLNVKDCILLALFQSEKRIFIYLKYLKIWPRRETTCLQEVRQNENQTRLSSYKTSKKNEISLVASLDIKLSKKRMTKALITLRGILASSPK